MIYLYGYLGIGAIVLAIVFIAHLLTKSGQDEEISDLLLALDSRQAKWWWGPLNKLVVPILAALALLVVWPIAIYWKMKEITDARRVKREEATKDFAVSLNDLEMRWTVAEVEAREQVSDPLGGVPRVPFGHLNPGWEIFKRSIREGDQLWSFSARWAPKWSRDEWREGYVVLRGDETGPHFLSGRAFVEKESEKG